MLDNTRGRLAVDRRLFQITVAVAALWLALSLFVYWRRRAANLTPVTAPRMSKDAQPEFLKVDHKAREAAIERGEAFENQLEIREAEERRAAEAAVLGPATTGRRLAKFASVLMSLFTLATLIAVIGRQCRPDGRIYADAVHSGRLMAVITIIRFGTAVLAVVLVIAIYQYFDQRKWRLEQREF